MISFFDSFRTKEGRETYGKIRKITLPAFFELFLISLKGVVDMIMVSNLGEQAVASVGLTQQPFFLLIAIFNAVNVGTTALVSWNVGKGDHKKAAAITRQAIIFNFGLGIIVSSVGFFGARHFFPLMIDDAQVIAYSTNFFQIITLSLAFHAVSMGITAAFRGAGQTKISMFYNLAGNALHLLLNFMLIHGNLGFPALGVQGAAISASIARGVTFLAAMSLLLFWKKSPIRLKLLSSWKPNFRTVRNIFSIGLPSAGEQFAIQTGLMVYTAMLASLGYYAFAAHTIAININMLAFAVSFAFGVSTTALVGQAVGRDDYDEAHRMAIFSARTARLVTSVVTISFIVFSRPILGIYTDNPVVIQYGIPVFYFMALTQFVQSSNMSTAGALRGSGDTMYPLYASIVGIWGTRLLLTALFVFVFNMGVAGGWFAFFLDQTVRSIVVKHRFNSGKWRGMKAVREAKAAARKAKMEGRS
ncbi:MAG: MATE family efflux transporter [Defluviitaleaceae bacterium]|nr:MATE family efflux transporter [Defluviitaleaceae bacterium]